MSHAQYRSVSMKPERREGNVSTDLSVYSKQRSI